MSDKEQPSSHTTRPSRLTDTIADAIESSYRDISAIISAKIELAKLDVAEIIASVAASLLIAAVALIGVAYFMIAAALLLGEMFGKPSFGFLAMGMLMSVIAVYFAKFSPSTLKNFFWKIVFAKLSELEQQKPRDETLENEK